MEVEGLRTQRLDQTRKLLEEDDINRKLWKESIVLFITVDC